MTKILVKSILAGLMISIGSIAYMNAPTYVGAFIFSIGLISIFQFNMYLFTGVVPYTNKAQEIPFLSLVLTGNIIGCCSMIAFPNELATTIVLSKMTAPHWEILISSILCNILIYVAVEANRKNNLATVILAVVTFIICGFNHSIANVCFVVSSRIFTYESILLIIISIIGNAIGGIVFRKLVEYAGSKNRKKLRG